MDAGTDAATECHSDAADGCGHDVPPPAVAAGIIQSALLQEMRRLSGALRAYKIVVVAGAERSVVSPLTLAYCPDSQQVVPG